MHPSELKNLALAAAAAAQRDGFPGTAEAWAEIAKTCALDALSLVGLGTDTVPFGTASNSMEMVAAVLFLV